MANRFGVQKTSLAERAKALENKIRWQHQMDLKGLLSIYPKDKIVKGAVLSFIVTVCISYLLLVVDIDKNDFLKDVVDLSLSVLPNLLGFLLGGYTILIGFGDIDLLKSTTTDLKGRNISLFQMLSSIFALTIYVQSLTLAIAIVAHFTMKIILKDQTGLLGVLYEVAPKINMVVTPILLFLLLYSVLSLRDMVMNVFGFAQQYHLSLIEKRMTDESKARKSNSQNE